MAFSPMAMVVDRGYLRVAIAVARGFDGSMPLAVQIAMKVVTLLELHGTLDGQRPFSEFSPLIEEIPFSEFSPLIEEIPFSEFSPLIEEIPFSEFSPFGRACPARAGAASAARVSPRTASFMATILI
jgi:hypothetical protein